MNEPEELTGFLQAEVTQADVGPVPGRRELFGCGGQEGNGKGKRNAPGKAYRRIHP